MKKLLVRLDASTAKELACPKKFEFQNLMGLQPVVPSHALEFGQAFHRAVAAWLRGTPGEEAIMIAVNYYAKSKCVVPEKDFRQPGMLVTALMTYFKTYKYDAFKVARNNSGELAVELPFYLPFLSFDHVDFVLTGVVDALGTQGVKCFKDIKTTSNKRPSVYLSDYEISLQMMLYSYILKTKGWCDYYPPYIIDGVFVGQSNPILERTQLMDVRPDLVEELIEWITEQCHHLAERIKNGKHLRNFAYCKANFGCDFYDVCAAQEAYREHLLNTKYTTRVYDPATFGTD